MKKILRFLSTLVIAAFLFVSCQNPAAGNNGDEPQNPPESTKKEYTVSFNNNCPSDNGSVWYMCSDYAPSSIKAKEGETVTLPSFSGELTKYVNNTEEGVYAFEKWNTSADGTGDSYIVGASIEVTGNMTFYAVYSTEKKSGGSDNPPDGDYIDLSTTSEYSMKVGDRIQLYVENADTYTVTTGDDVVSIDSDNVMEAIGAGNATVQVSIKNSIRTYSLVVIVTADPSDSNHNPAVVGMWVNGESYIQFNADGSGYLYYKSGSYTTLNTTCSWNTSTAGGKNWLNISGCNPNGSDGSYEYIVSATRLNIHGRLALGIPMDTEWIKE